MALTKITRGVIKANENYDTHNINSTGIVTAVSANFTGNVSIGGTLTYQDVTNIDSVGVITARDAIVISEDNAIHFRGTAADDADAILRASAGGGQLLINSRNDSIINIDSNNDSTDAHFAVAHGAATGSSTELFRVQENGNVGINETSPTAHLVVKQSGNTFTTQSQTVALFQRSSTAGHGAKIAIVAGTGGSSDINFGDTADEDIGSIQYYHTDNSFRFTTNTSERLRIDSSGNLNLVSSSSSLTDLNFTASDLSVYARVEGGKSGSGVGDLRFHTYSGGLSESMRIDSSGRLLLNSGTDVRIELGTTGSTGTNNRNHLRGDGTNMKYNCCAGGGHFFEANGGERMRISSNGHINIGSGYIVSNSGLHVGRSSGGTAAGESIIAATLGNDSTMVSALLTVKNAGNRGAQGASGGSPLAKFEFNNGTAFEIDKYGYRTLPYQPCAMAYNAQGQHMAGNAVAQFNSTYFNIGNMYNSSNGRMTVPVAGRYLVAYSGLHDYVSQNAIGFDFLINGSNFDGGEGYQECTTSSNSQLAKTLILNLSANDYVQIFIRQSGTQVHQRYGSFSMCLIT